MMRFAALALAGLFTIALSAPTIASTSATPVGTWQISTGESRYSVSTCGAASQLCAKLVWLRADAKTPENLQLLNQYVVRGARPIAPHQWSGSVQVAGETLQGSLTQVSANLLSLKGCKGVFCKSVQLVRI